jgi:hypothetical protein
VFAVQLEVRIHLLIRFATPAKPELLKRPSNGSASGLLGFFLSFIADVKFEMKMDYTARDDAASAAAPVDALDLLNAIYTRRTEVPDGLFASFLLISSDYTKL